MSSFLVLREGGNRNRWRDGQVCPDVRQGIMTPLETKKEERDERERGTVLGGKKRKSPALDEEDMRGEPWLEWTGRER
ncbi:hypothetical protein TNCV_3407541 [Trichonephila clavipes]|uniref:Uncharacterized protein n=1 Tax=Trichonephila clavipes TaxID=2585209 RepID=A0A8X6R4E3_TRICX|nr:hypothetical protein TNCV_3407541 [Trichonephila clavipes]